MNRVFKTRFFSRWMRKTDLTEKALCDAVLEMIQGLIDADLGGDLLSMSATALDLACQRDELQEICHENEK
jgi:hypothetical protein